MALGPCGADLFAGGWTQAVVGRAMVVALGPWGAVLPTGGWLPAQVVVGTLVVALGPLGAVLFAGGLAQAVVGAMTVALGRGRVELCAWGQAPHMVLVAAAVFGCRGVGALTGNPNRVLGPVLELGLAGAGCGWNGLEEGTGCGMGGGGCPKGGGWGFG